MKNKSGLWPLVVIPFVVIASAVYYVRSHDIALLNPQGTIARQQYDLLVFATVLSLFVVLPVYALTFFIVVKYHEGNKKSKYRPDWDSSRILETIWWGIPITLIFILSLVTWRTSHTLDPFRPIASDNQTLKIQVVALDWKWLFIYPEQGVASVNYVVFPTNRPVDFNITSDAPMNSFWIPNLGGQIYAMSGMNTQLHLMADGDGTYRGVSANISGTGFAGMSFEAKSVPDLKFEEWVQSVKQSGGNLDINQYNKLAKPSQNNKPQTYAKVDSELYNKILMKYMLPSGQIVKAGQQ